MVNINIYKYRIDILKTGRGKISGCRHIVKHLLKRVNDDTFRALGRGVSEKRLTCVMPVTSTC